MAVTLYITSSTVVYIYRTGPKGSDRTEGIKFGPEPDRIS